MHAHLSSRVRGLNLGQSRQLHPFCLPWNSEGSDNTVNSPRLRDPGSAEPKLLVQDFS